jgi:hypothetical protein
VNRLKQRGWQKTANMYYEVKTGGFRLQNRDFQNINNNHLSRLKHIENINHHLKPIKLFKEYLRIGYYPGESDRLKQIVNHLLETDLPSVEKIDLNANTIWIIVIC